MSNTSIKKRLFLLMITIGIIPFAAAVIFIGLQTAQQWEQTSKAAAWSKNVNLNQHLTQISEKNLYVLRTLTFAPAIKNYLANPNPQDEEEALALLNNTNKLLQDDNLMAVTSASGLQLLRTDRSPKVNISQRRHFQEAMEGREYVSDAIVALATGKTQIVLVTPVMGSNNKPIGLVQRNFNLNMLGAYLAEHNDNGTDIIILDDNNNVIAHSNKGDNSYAQNIQSTDIYQTVLRKIEGSEGANRLMLANKEYLVTYSRNQLTRWNIITISPYSSIWAAVNTTVFRGMVLGLSLLFIVILTAQFLSDYLTRPIREITSVLTGLASGRKDIAQLTALPDNELGKMALAINEMRNIHRNIKDPTQVDKLTGLHNAESAEAVCRQRIQEYQETTLYPGLIAILLIDLDNFKKASAKVGHEHGNQILKEFASRLTDIFTVKDCIGRIEGDEFIVILDHQPDTESIREKASNILQVARNLTVDGNHAGLTASIGVSIAPHNGKSYNHLYHAADLALYAAKHEGRDRYKLADELEG